ncbi:MULTISPECIES: hypothetical protein [unclassified Novosphingobium]|uniref:hypothetical protein n=1 Tax=unclassified Novosphingobium TaxID=2644732 RepID=UPI000EB919E1|nr:MULTISPECIES: hypothetical protein [unclassified Novosphingobium]HCF24493.1 hypothetical protein [Novosphingobium sp.]HQV03790.1 hypothetical protein [Novosphingobium sp.]
MASGSAFAQGAPAPVTATAPAVAKALPANSVSCVYDSLSDEDREISLLLIAREIVDGGSFRKTSKNVQGVDRLIEEAHQKCLARYNWSIGRSFSATDYALTAIMHDALAQAMEAIGFPASPLGEFYRDNLPALAGKSRLSAADQARLKEQLKAKGWDKANEAQFALAGFYIETMMLKAESQRRFNSFGGTGRQPIRRPPIPASKAKRGKP